MADDKQMLDNILDALHCGTWQWDLITNKVILDERWAEILGYTLVELKSVDANTSVSFSHPDDVAVSRTAADDHIAGRSERFFCEVRMRHKNGHWIWVQDSGCISERDVNGKPLKMVGARLDITNRKNAEEAYRHENERFKALTYTSNTGAWEWDTDTKHLWCSPEYFTMLGINPEGYYNERQPNLDNVWVQLLHPDDIERATKCFADYLATDTTDIYQSEFRLAHADGSWVWIWSRGRTLRDAQGQRTSKTLGTHTNITKIKNTEAEIRELNITLEQRVNARTAELSATLENLRRAQEQLLQNEKLASLGALVAGVAHELNTPIGNAMMVSTSLALTNKNFQEQVEQGLTRNALSEFMQEISASSIIIERNLSRAAELIRSFKQLAVDQASYQRRHFNLHELSSEISLTMHPTLRKTPYQFIDNTPDALMLDSYPGPLGQVLINLINNAIIHGFDGRAQGTITLNAQLSDDKQQLSLTLQDDGIGIPAKDQKKVFDPFFTTKLGQGGSGLGLHIIYTLVTGLLGGSINVHSQVGQGTIFTMVLPVCAPPAPTE